MLAELLPTRDSHKVLADLCLPFRASYLDPVVKADQCAQYVDDIGVSANNATDLTQNIWAVFQRICNAGLKFKIEKFHFGVRQVEFLGELFHPREYHHKLTRFKYSRINWGFPNWSKVCSDIWGSWKITKITFPGRLKISNLSINSKKQESQSASPQNWKKTLIG